MNTKIQASKLTLLPFFMHISGVIENIISLFHYKHIISKKKKM